MAVIGSGFAPVFLQTWDAVRRGAAGREQQPEAARGTGELLPEYSAFVGDIVAQYRHKFLRSSVARGARLKPPSDNRGDLVGSAARSSSPFLVPRLPAIHAFSLHPGGWEAVLTAGRSRRDGCLQVEMSSWGAWRRATSDLCWASVGAMVPSRAQRHPGVTTAGGAASGEAEPAEADCGSMKVNAPPLVGALRQHRRGPRAGLVAITLKRFAHALSDDRYRLSGPRGGLMTNSSSTQAWRSFQRSTRVRAASAGRTTTRTSNPRTAVGRLQSSVSRPGCRLVGRLSLRCSRQPKLCVTHFTQGAPMRRQRLFALPPDRAEPPDTPGAIYSSDRPFRS